MSIRLRSTALAAGGALVASMIGATALPAVADESIELSSEPVTVECDWDCSQDELQTLINDAGTTPTTIVLGLIDTYLTETLVIPEGSDITLLNAPIDIPNYVNDTGLTREDGFTGRLIHIQKGAKLTLDSNEKGLGTTVVRARGEWVEGASHQPSIYVEGELVMEKGRVEGARKLQSMWQGAITVRGEDAKLVLNGGTVTDNHRMTGKPGSVQYGAGNIALDRGATMVMNGGDVSDGLTERNPGSYGETGGIGVFNGSHLTVNGGTISGNRGWSGNIGVFSWLSDNEFDAAESLRSTVEINGGEIKDGYAEFGGGGVSIFGNGDVTMNDGTITNNTANNGGGVNAMDLYVWGADNSWQEVPGDGKENGYSPEEWTEISPGGFTMNGGTISDNGAYRTGGGVNVVSNGVKLLGGTIEGNWANSQGGGLYVATRSYTTHVQNALVTENYAEPVGGKVAKGGGIWLCPTGDLTMHVTDGGAIFDNQAPTPSNGEDYYGADFAHDNYGTVNPAKLKLDSLMLGGGSTAYFKDGGTSSPRYNPDNPGKQQIFQDPPADPIEGDPNLDLNNVEYRKTLQNAGLINVVGSEDAKTQAAAWASLIITGNTAPRGAGIGSNGEVVFGTPGSTEISVSKEWKESDGDELAEDLRFPVKVQLQANFVGEDTKFNIGNPIILNENNNWTYKFTDLPTANQGKILEYSVVEDVDGLPSEKIVADVQPALESDGTFIVTNTLELISIPVEKIWEGGDEGDRPESVTVELLRDGKSTGQTIELNAENGWKAEFTDLQPYRAWNAEKQAFDEYVYSVEEVGVANYEAEVTGNQVDGFTITNTFTPPSTPSEPTEPTTTPSEPSEPTTTPETPEEPGLPKTGTNTAILGATALALLMAGAGVVFYTRRQQ